MRLEPFEAVVTEHGPTVLRVCRALLGPVDADDAWSETFVAALRAYPDLRPGSNVRGWLVTIAHRKAVDQIRSRNRAPRPVERVGETPAPEAAPADDDLRAALDALAPKQRTAVVLHHIAGLPYAAVGAHLDTTEAAARRSAADGIANLRKTYRKGGT
ncbi:MAG: polymerase sigma factor [Actinomycetia bacterium]|nr:polymerase sigma factor [Actinomycetes bacterium]